MILIILLCCCLSSIVGGYMMLIKGKEYPKKENIKGLYTVDSFKDDVWVDRKGEMGDLVTSGLSVEGDAIVGTKESTIEFVSKLPEKYTFAYVAKYNGDNKKRIFSGKDNNWLSGFHNGNTGVAYHEGWVTSGDNKVTDDYLVGIDTQSKYYANGEDLTVKGHSARALVTVNLGEFKQLSDFAIKAIIVYDINLEEEDVKKLYEKLKTV